MRHVKVNVLINFQSPFTEARSVHPISQYLPEDNYRELIKQMGIITGVKPHRTAFHDRFGHRVWKDAFEYVTDNGTRCVDVVWAEVGY